MALHAQQAEITFCVYVPAPCDLRRDRLCLPSDGFMCTGHCTARSRILSLPLLSTLAKEKCSWRTCREGQPEAQSALLSRGPLSRSGCWHHCPPGRKKEAPVGLSCGLTKVSPQSNGTQAGSQSLWGGLLALLLGDDGCLQRMVAQLS